MLFVNFTSQHLAVATISSSPLTYSCTTDWSTILALFADFEQPKCVAVSETALRYFLQQSPFNNTISLATILRQTGRERLISRFNSQLLVVGDDVEAAVRLMRDYYSLSPPLSFFSRERNSLLLHLSIFNDVLSGRSRGLSAAQLLEISRRYSLAGEGLEQSLALFLETGLLTVAEGRVTIPAARTFSGR